MKKISTAILTLGLTFISTVTIASAETHTVEQGDNLSNIAKEYNTTIDEIVQRNELDSTVIHPGQELALNEMYEVVKGDTLYWIAKDHDTTVDDLMELNELSSSLLTIGQKLKINGDKPTETVNEQEEVATAVNNESKNQKTTNELENQEMKNEKTANKSKQVNTSEKPEGKTVNVTATAYTAECEGCSGVTSTGINLLENRDLNVIAVDPSVIPLGTKVYVEGYGHAVAGDTGGAIKGNKIDVHVPTKSESLNWGVKENVKVTIVE